MTRSRLHLYTVETTHDLYVVDDFGQLVALSDDQIFAHVCHRYY